MDEERFLVCGIVSAFAIMAVAVMIVAVLMRILK